MLYKPFIFLFSPSLLTSPAAKEKGIHTMLCHSSYETEIHVIDSQLMRFRVSVLKLPTISPHTNTHI